MVIIKYMVVIRNKDNGEDRVCLGAEMERLVLVATFTFRYKEPNSALQLPQCF